MPHLSQLLRPLGALRLLLLAALLMLCNSPSWAQDTVVYHVNDTASQALGTLRNIRNHLDSEAESFSSVPERRPKTHSI